MQAAVGTAVRGRGGMEEHVGRGFKEAKEDGGRGEAAADVEAICEIV